MTVVGLLQQLTAWNVLQLQNTYLYIYGHGNHVETGYCLWFASLGPYSHLTLTSGSGDVKHLK